MVHAEGRVFAFACLQCHGCLDILPAEIEMAEHFPAEACVQHAALDEALQLPRDFLHRRSVQSQVDIDDGIALVLHGTAAGKGVLHVIADGKEGQVFLIDKPRPNQHTQIGMGREPAAGSDLLADLDIIGVGLCEQGSENLMQGIAGGVAAHQPGRKGVGHHLGEVFQDEAKGIVQRDAAFCDQQAVGRPPASGDVDAQGGGGKLIAGIIEISGLIKRLLVIGILLETGNNVSGFLAGTQHGFLQIPHIHLFCCYDGKIHADQQHGIGNHTVCQVKEGLDGGVFQAGIHQRLVPSVVEQKNFLKLCEDVRRVCLFRKDAEVRVILLRKRKAVSGQDEKNGCQVMGGNCEIRIGHDINSSFLKSHSFPVWHGAGEHRLAA